MNVKKIQEGISKLNGDGWLFYDVHNRDKIAYKILGLDAHRLTTRRWFYFIPTKGEPTKLVHTIEKGRLDELPGKVLVYLSWKDMNEKLAEILSGCKKVFMQYSPYNNIPMISYADAGTVELIRSFYIEVISSADLVQYFEARLDEEEIELHKLAGKKIQRIKDLAFELIMDSSKLHRTITEYEVQDYILKLFEKENLTCDDIFPMVAVNSHAANGHFELTKDNSLPIRRNDRVLIDLWAKENVPKGIYYDITWCGYVGETAPEQYAKLFSIVVCARDIAKEFIINRLRRLEPIFGWEVDDICRNYIMEKGYGDYFLHRTGHSIHTSVHGNGVNLDNLETRDDRQIIRGTCFSIEPGIYIDDIGVRSEINVLVDNQNNVIVVGEQQKELIVMK